MRKEQNDILDVYAHRSRFTPTEVPVEDVALTEHVEQLLSALTPEQREAVEVRGFGGLGGVQAARLLGLSTWAFYLRWYRAIEQITGETPEPLKRERHRQRKRTFTPEQRARRREAERLRYQRRKAHAAKRIVEQE